MAKYEFKTLTSDDILTWCAENNQLDWLDENWNKKVLKKVYPKVKDEKTGRMKADKTAKPTMEMVQMDFQTLKIEFCKKFMKDILPTKQPAKLSFSDKIAALKAQKK